MLINCFSPVKLFCYRGLSEELKDRGENYFFFPIGGT